MRLKIDRQRRRAVTLPPVAGRASAGCGGSSTSGGRHDAELPSITLPAPAVYMAAYPGVKIKTTRLSLDDSNPVGTHMQAAPTSFASPGSEQASSVDQLGKEWLLLQLKPSVAANIPASQMSSSLFYNPVLDLPSSNGPSNAVNHNGTGQREKVERQLSITEVEDLAAMLEKPQVTEPLEQSI